MTDQKTTTPQASEKARHLVYVIEAVAREIIEGKAPATAGGKARAALLTYIAQLEQKAAERDEMMTQVYMYAKERDKVLEQLEAERVTNKNLRDLIVQMGNVAEIARQNYTKQTWGVDFAAAPDCTVTVEKDGDK